ncbi:COMM domain-containing protein 10 [Lethenteron reissneri]|uniref:COMM domain-containing protein 10 n=1 Tax=Lethenteron reissneri TaxID=7753 RepID=UPI002AB6EC2F|nr:COMM domain-containing protein 10 [Lethenteron reissneri]
MACITETESIKQAVSIINTIDDAKFPRLLSRILQKLHLKDERSFSPEEEEKLMVALDLQQPQLELTLETCTFILQQAAYHSWKPAVMEKQLAQLHVTEAKCHAFLEAWAAGGRNAVDRLRQRSMAPKTLESMSWQLNLQLAQTTRARIKTPSAVLELGIQSDDNQELEKVQMELTHQELFEFYKKLEMIQSQLDALS